MFTPPPKWWPLTSGKVTAERRIIGSYEEPAERHPRVVEFIELESASGVGITVSTLGASLVSVRAPDRYGKRGEIAVAPKDLSEAVELAPHYMGVTMGRYARIVSNARFSLDDQVHRLDANWEGHHLHGGSVGFDRLVWTATLEHTENGCSVVLELERPDGDQGYPGDISVRARFTLHWNGTLIVDYSAETQSDTIVGLTSHAFWDLSAAQALGEHKLRLNAAHHIEMDRSFVPTGKRIGIDGCDLDFRTPRSLRGVSIDNCFALANDARDVASLETPACELSHPASGRKLFIHTDQPCLAIYTGDGLPADLQGICIQASPMPDAPNQPEFETVRLKRGETYANRTIIRILADETETAERE